MLNASDILTQNKTELIIIFKLIYIKFIWHVSHVIETDKYMIVIHKNLLKSLLYKFRFIKCDPMSLT